MPIDLLDSIVFFERFPISTMTAAHSSTVPRRVVPIPAFPRSMVTM
jgi:hypothetical protein